MCSETKKIELRNRQKVFFEKAVAALEKHGDTIGIAPTGAGKTILMSAVMSYFLKKDKGMRILVLQHRDVLVDQNNTKFQMFLRAQNVKCSVFNSKKKNADGDVVFAMIQTACRDQNIELLPFFDMVVIDETHHISSDSYQKVIDFLKEKKPNIKIFGVTATPARGDKKKLPYFTNICDQIFFGDLVAEGLLAKPKVFEVDVGVSDELSQLKVKGSDFDDDEMAKILNKKAINETVANTFIEEKLGKTAVFASNIEHAIALQNVFQDKGVRTGLIVSTTPKNVRADLLEEFQKGDLNVLINVMVLTEGWDCPECSNIILLRKSAQKPLLTQIIGRAARPLKGKESFNVFDFGLSVQTHGLCDDFLVLEESDRQREEKEKEEKEETSEFFCPNCGIKFQSKQTVCPICTVQIQEFIEKIEKKEAILASKPDSFRWSDFWGKNVYIAAGMKATALIFFSEESEDFELWAGGKRKISKKLAGDLEVLRAIAEKFLFDKEDSKMAESTAEWMTMEPSKKQLEYINQRLLDEFQKKSERNASRYDLSCFMSVKFARKNFESPTEEIKNLLKTFS